MVEMGSGFCSIEEAMKLLGKSRRQIYVYMKKGLIRKKRVQGQACIVKEDVIALKSAADLDVAFNKAGFINLIQRVQLLERAVELLSRSAEIANIPLRFQETGDAYLFYQSANYVLTMADDKITLDDMVPWVGVLPSLDDVALKKLAELTGDKQAWLSFYKVGIKLLKILEARPDQETRMDVQQMISSLKQGLSSIRLALLVWMEDGELGYTSDYVMQVLKDMEK